MAEINNLQTGDLYLGLTLNVIRKEPEHGMLERNCVSMNSDMKLIWLEVGYHVGQNTIFQHEVVVHSADIFRFVEMAQDIITNPAPARHWYTEHKLENGYDRTLYFDITSPELTIRLNQTAHLPEIRREKYDLPLDEHDPEVLRQRIAEQLEMNPNNPRIDQILSDLDDTSCIYELLVVVDFGVARGAEGVSNEGPAIFLQPYEDQLLSFLRDLRSETEMAILLG